MVLCWEMMPFGTMTTMMVFVEQEGSLISDVCLTELALLLKYPIFPAISAICFLCTANARILTDSNDTPTLAEQKKGQLLGATIFSIGESVIVRYTITHWTISVVYHWARAVV